MREGPQASVPASQIIFLYTMSNSLHARRRGIQLLPILVPGGGERDRTDDLRLAKPALSQLSYTPLKDPAPAAGRSRTNGPDLQAIPERVVGLGRLELPTSRLSGVRSNQLSYRPVTAPPAKVRVGPVHLDSIKKRCEDGGGLLSIENNRLNRSSINRYP